MVAGEDMPYRLGMMRVIGGAFDDTAVAPYARGHWPKIFATISRILPGSSRPSIRARRVDTDFNTVKTGRPKWNMDSDQLWIGTEEENPNGYFREVDFWSPSVAACSRERRSPEVFFMIKRVFGRGAIASSCVIAVDEVLGKTAQSVGIELMSALRPTVAAQCARPWGIATPDGMGFHDSVYDMAPYDDIVEGRSGWERT
jgi:hypothetical protein